MPSCIKFLTTYVTLSSNMTIEQSRPHGHEHYLFGPEWFTSEKVKDDLTAIREPHHDEDVLSYILKGPSGTLIVDTGMGLASLKSLLDDENATVLLTHTHWDHLGSAWEFDRVLAYEGDYSEHRLHNGWKREETVGYETEYFLDNAPSDEELARFYIPPVPKPLFLHDAQILEICGLTVEVVHTPGHTPDGACFYIHETGDLFVGDTLYAGPQFLHLAESDTSDYEYSLRKLQAFIERCVQDNKQVYIRPGHNASHADIDLLEQHIDAFDGNLLPESVEHGTDEFGEFVCRKYKDFSLLMPGSGKPVGMAQT